MNEAQPQANAEQEKDPAQIRDEIEETREGLGETVEALAAKTDVKGQAQQKVEETRRRLQTDPTPLAIAVAAGVGLIAVAIVRRRRRR